MRQSDRESLWDALTLGLVLCSALACSGSKEQPLPAPGFGVLSGQTVLVLPVQYVERLPGGWIGGAADYQEAARAADTEISFALNEVGGRSTWVMAERQAAELARRPSLGLHPYLLSADEARREGGDLRNVRDPLYGEIRMRAALFETRYALWPMEILYETDPEGGGSHLAIRTFVLDARAGSVVWYGVIREAGGQPPASAGALAALAQAFAVQVSP